MSNILSWCFRNHFKNVEMIQSEEYLVLPTLWKRNLKKKYLWNISWMIKQRLVRENLLDFYHNRVKILTHCSHLIKKNDQVLPLKAWDAIIFRNFCKGFIKCLTFETLDQKSSLNTPKILWKITWGGIKVFHNSGDNIAKKKCQWTFLILMGMKTVLVNYTFTFQ